MVPDSIPSTAVGKTAAVGYQIGVRRTFRCTPEAALVLLLSATGMTIWLGGAIARLSGPYRLLDGTCGEVRVWHPESHLRLTWQPPGWAQPSSIQIRVLLAKTGTTIAFHQERLASPAERAAMQGHWERVLARLGELLIT